ncbi:hypothetical protein GLX30_21320 [Streptomyces sp. Tu 2975]|uniref:hypothetical protein n=1 Tax=Streptomyces sp. Tu 2975 TaxID=2676871 RepID=UPI001359C0B4|nr:hypothetical protein [Streptomyces sp. Tu 2975]QIP86155.1 hypothetical protein GLX30_21320 [Streptomyces sp. Tu 2975]
MPGIDECLLQAMVVPGARGAAIVDWTSGLALGSIGETPGGDHEATAAETAELARMAAEYPTFAPEGETAPDGAKGLPVEDLIVTTRTGYHVVRFVETTFDSSVFLHIWLDRETGNLALARLRLADLAERLVLG